MKKVFKPAQVEIVELNMTALMSGSDDSQGFCGTFTCANEGTAKEDWNEDFDF